MFILLSYKLTSYVLKIRPDENFLNGRFDFRAPKHIEIIVFLH